MFFVFHQNFQFQFQSNEIFCHVNFLFFLWKFFYIDLFGFSKFLAKCLSWDVAKGTAGKHFFFLFLSFSSFFIFHKVRKKVGKYFISSFFLIYLLSNIFVSYFWCCCLALPCIPLPFTILFLIYTFFCCMLNSLFYVWWKYDLWHSGLYLGLFSVGILFRGGKGRMEDFKG